MRAKWKYNFVKVKPKEKSVESIKSRSLEIASDYVGMSLKVKDGLLGQNLLIKKRMVGYKMGEFILTKKIGKIHRLRKKSNSYRKKK